MSESGLEGRLREKALRVTAPRLAVLGAVDEHPHADTDALAKVVRSRLGSVSHQTVYDVLRILTEVGLIRRIQPAGATARYETRVSDNHHHLVCRVCRTIVDVDCAVGQSPCLHAGDGHGFEVDEAEVVYWGTCPDCLARSSASELPREGIR
jgi:Fur family transcriptional regulator, stress-responsive regulator